MSWSSPRTWVAGEVVTAALMNAHVRDNFLALGGARLPYTPSWTATGTNPVLGNGTLSGYYSLPGRNCIYSIALFAGSSTTYGSGFFLFSIPWATTKASNTAIGAGAIVDASSGARYGCTAFVASSSQIVFGLSGTTAGSTVPMAAGVSDQWSVEGLYEAA